MEEVVYEDSPLATYLEGEGSNEHTWEPAVEDSPRSTSTDFDPSFAPRGIPTVALKFRHSIPPPLRIRIPRNTTVAAIHNTCSRALNSRLGRADNEKFLERFRYIIIASQLLSELSQHGHNFQFSEDDNGVVAPELGSFTMGGVGFTASIAFVFAYLMHWARGGRSSSTTASRAALVLTILLGSATVAYTYMRRHWLQWLRQQALEQISNFVARAQSFNSVVGAATSLIQEVELVSRGYRLSTPLPPISRLEDRSQQRRCIRLRKALQYQLSQLFPQYNQACATLQPLAEASDLERYFDIYDLSEMDLKEASLGWSAAEFEDADGLRALKILVARFHVTRKLLLCCLLAINADGGKPDFSRWSTVVEEIKSISAVTMAAEEKLRGILSEEEDRPVPSTPKLPLTPGRERWRSQLRKISTLSTGIRGLQAKMHILREESDKALDESEDLSDLGPNLMFQYEAIGEDLRALMQGWEEGRLALASNIDRNERRISSMSMMSGMMSPAISLGGLTSVDEGTPVDALKALNGEDPFRSPPFRLSGEFSNSDPEEVFEAIALPRQRSSLTREERIVKIKEDREKRASLQDRRTANTHMLKELESVINLRPKGRKTPTPRVTSI